MNAWCLFEQSGTFKNEFKKFGIEAFDVDIQNEFGQTDFIVDLFHDIDVAFEGGADTIFDRIDQNDVVLAFFPCTRFECQIKLYMSGDSYGLNKWTDERKLNYAMKLHEELCLFYRTFARMFIVAIRKGIKMIVENPYTQPHYLTAYFPIKPTMLDKDRSMNGDYYKKPTQYWFINCKPQTNMLLEAEDWRSPITIDNPSINGASRTTSKSMIHPSYARKFIYNNILTKQQIKEGGTL